MNRPFLKVYLEPDFRLSRCSSGQHLFYPVDLDTFVYKGFLPQERNVVTACYVKKKSGDILRVVSPSFRKKITG